MSLITKVVTDTNMHIKGWITEVVRYDDVGYFRDDCANRFGWEIVFVQALPDQSYLAVWKIMGCT